MEQLRNLIKSKDYSSRLENIEQIVGNIAGKTRILFPKYTNHGVDHLKNVERHANNILTDDIKKQLSEGEIFCLLCGIWLHDIGMVPIDEEIDIYETKSEEDRENYRDAIRNVHHIRSENYILKNHKQLRLNKLEAKIIGKIAKCHRKVNLNELESIMYNGKLIDVAALGAIVRLADEFDISKDRETPLSSEGIDDYTLEEHYSIHGLVNDVWIDHDEYIIYLSCNIENEKEFNMINGRKTEIQNKLDETAPYLKNIGINLKHIKLDCHYDPLIEKEIICKLADYDFNISEWDFFNISDSKIQEILCNLKAESLFNSDDYTLGFKETFSIYKKLFEKFIGYYNLKNFFFTKYSQVMVETCFDKIESKFGTVFQSGRNSRIEILKNTPTAFYLILIFEDLLGDNKFKLNYNKNGDMIIDFLLLMSIFNDNYYFNDQIDFDTVKCHINDLIKDKTDIQSKINKYIKSSPQIQKSEVGTDEGRIPFSIKLNLHEGFENFTDFTPTSENPIKIVGDRIEYIEVGEGDDYKKYTPDVIIISKQDNLELKINNNSYNNVEFKKEIISDDVVLFTSKPLDEIPLILKLKFKFDFKDNNHKFSLSFIPTSNKIKDILNQIKFKKNCSEKYIEVKYENKTIFKDNFPRIYVDEKFIKFLEKVNYINDYFDLNMIYDEEYIITKEDEENVDVICNYIQNKTIIVNDIRVKFEICASQINDILEYEYNDIEIINPQFKISLLGKNIELGSFKVKIDSLKIINQEELLNILNSHKPEDVVDVEMILAEEYSDLILDFKN